MIAVFEYLMFRGHIFVQSVVTEVIQRQISEKREFISERIKRKKEVQKDV